MEIHVSPIIYEIIPAFKLGILEYENITISQSPQMLTGRLQLLQENIFFELENKNVPELPGIMEWRQLFKKFGKDPNRYRPSAEALFRRVKKQQFLQPVNSAVDVNNFFSLHYEIPLGLYDKSALQGDIAIRLGDEHEEYEGLNGRKNSLHNLLISTDNAGAFGSPFVDSIRTSINEETVNAIHILYIRPSLENEECTKIIQSVAKMFTQIHGGDCKTKLISQL
ncbi:hypothetical protein J9303_04915 [Bacillaceae bacterium Marseille-Q3522]|nr:hypothetical protein [Bacillaceae bacterium Marseille-Q3522]